MKSVVLIGYSGHSFVIADALQSMAIEIKGYCDKAKKGLNPYDLEYIGDERELVTINRLTSYDFIVGVGHNKLRQRILENTENALGYSAINAIHSTAVVGHRVVLGTGVFIGANSVISPLVEIGKGVICNTGSIIEHESVIGDFVHVGPGAVLCGGVKVSQGSFIGANAVIKQGVKIGMNVVIGAGTVVLKDIPSNSTYVGNPQRRL